MREFSSHNYCCSSNACLKFGHAACVCWQPCSEQFVAAEQLGVHRKDEAVSCRGSTAGPNSCNSMLHWYNCCRDVSSQNISSRDESCPHLTSDYYENFGIEKVSTQHLIGSRELKVGCHCCGNLAKICMHIHVQYKYFQLTWTCMLTCRWSTPKKKEMTTQADPLLGNQMRHNYMAILLREYVSFHAWTRPSFPLRILGTFYLF